MKIHVKMDIAGFLKNHTKKKDYANLFTDDTGRFIHPDDAKAKLIDMLAEGRKYLPFGECEGFSYETGCPGHDDDHA